MKTPRIKQVQPPLNLPKMEETLSPLPASTDSSPKRRDFKIFPTSSESSQKGRDLKLFPLGEGIGRAYISLKCCVICLKRWLRVLPP